MLPPRLLAHARLKTPALRRCRLCLSLRVLPSTAVRCYAKDLQAEKTDALRTRLEGEAKERSFQGQVMGSIGARLRREREQREEYEKWRELTDPSRNWMTTFVFLSGIGIAYYLGTFWPQGLDPRSTLPLAKTQEPQHNIKVENLRAAWVDFVKIVGRDNVSTLETNIKHHAKSSWSSHQPKPDEKPFCVVYPGSTEEVAAVMKVCHWRKIPVVAFSGGTSVEGQYVQTRKGVSIDFGRMDKVLALHEADLDVVVQPAVGWEVLNGQLAEHGLFFPPDPGPGAMIGGMVATGCNGTNAFCYGTMRDWVLSLTVVLADGTVIKTRQRPRKSSAGYDLTKLFIGSEGTLGLVTEATLKVAVKPASTSVAVCSFPTVKQAAECVSDIVREAVPLAAVELLDDNAMRGINAAGLTPRRWAEAPTLFLKFAGTPAGVREQVALVQRLAARPGGSACAMARDEAEQEALWSARKEVLWSFIAEAKDSARIWTGDVAVPTSCLPELVEATQEDMRRSGLHGAIVGHVGDGNFHALLSYSLGQRERAEAVVHRMVKRAIEMEGTVTGGHGVGLVKRDYLPYELGESTVDAMRQIKKAFDPLCLLNCDKVVRMQKPKRGELEVL